MSRYTTLVNRSKWPEEQCTALRNHVEGGRLSYSGIANALNEEFDTHYSRQAAIGKASRLGLSNPFYLNMLSAPKKPRKPQVYKPRPKPQPVFLPAEIIQLRCSEIMPEHVGIVEAVGCRWPYGDSDFTFCNHAQLEGSSYCELHFQLSVGRGTASERRANQMVPV